ncbi:MAG: helix-turn-helix domain-containing protein [Gammaproteobacteria bacterium]|nr:helix-turn-helix domain-containing protein [Gammaproteobacteria bacterium]
MRENFYLHGESVDSSDPYEYRSCGLDGIFLLNGVETEEHDGEESVSIKNIDGLHVAIGKHLVLNRKGLTPKEIKFLRKTMEMTQQDLAKGLGNDAQSVARWEKGEFAIPAPAEKLLRAMFYAAYILTKEDLEALKTLIVERLGQLDDLDQIEPLPVQFMLGDHWTERQVA